MDLPFFPGSEKLRDKWWHRLARVVMMFWFAVVGVGIFSSLLGMFYSFQEAKYFREKYGMTLFELPAYDAIKGDVFEIIAWIFSIGVVIGIYRVTLYIIAGDDWKSDVD